MSPRPDVSEARKIQILDAATSVFARLGFQKARMDDIVEESKLSKGALYWYFKSKDDIIISIFENLLNREMKDLNDLIEAEGPPIERLRQFPDIVIDDFVKLEPIFPLLFEFIAMASRSKTLRKLIQSYFNRYVDHLALLIQQGINAGEVVPLDAEKLAITLSAILEGTVLAKIYDPKRVDLEDQLRFSIRFYLDSISIEKSLPKE